MESTKVGLFGISLSHFIDLNKVAKYVNDKQKIYKIHIIKPIKSIGEPDPDGQYDINKIYEYCYPSDPYNIRFGITSQKLKLDNDKKDLLYSTINICLRNRCNHERLN